jgi:PASTA domain/Regulator of chromosome condensation (RCC1) repeat
MTRGPLHWFCALALLSAGLLFAPGAAGATAGGRPVAWGCGAFNDHGQCSVLSGLSDATAIAAGFSHSLALKDDGTVVAWGCVTAGTDHGQCSVPVGLSGVTAIAAGSAHSLALKSDGTVVAWGCGVGNDRGQCSVPVGLSGVTAIAAGTSHSLALKSDGTVVAWGCSPSSNFGQCSVPIGLSGVTAIAAGETYSLAVKSGGTVVAWGCSGFPEFGCLVPGGLSGVTAVAAGDRHSLALKGDGTVVAWGCGSGTDFGQCSPPNGLAGVTAIAAGWSQSLALKGDGTVVAWGCGDYPEVGQCGIPSGLVGATAIAAGTWHSLAVVVPTNQTVTFGALAPKTYGDPDFSVSATASSGLAVSFAASGTCRVSGATVHLTGAGSCAITASQAGNVSYNPAPSVSQTFAIAKAGQSISFGPLSSKRYGAPAFIVDATASSGLAVSFTARGRCTVRGATVRLTGAGSCTVTASQPGDANYNPAPDVSRTFSIAAAQCRVPKVVGKRVAAAKRMIARKHCRTGKVRHAYSSKRERGIVISQSRRPGKVLPARSKIDLLVSRGRRR